MSRVTTFTHHGERHQLSLLVLTAYVAVATTINGVRIGLGHGSLVALGCQLAILCLSAYGLRGRSNAALLTGGWLPYLSLPVLYWTLPWSMWSGPMHDELVQGWDRAMSGTNPARTMAAGFPVWWVSESLHLAYLSYYPIIYGPPLMLYLVGPRAAFERMGLGFTIAMVVAFVVFSVFPVEGPRYAWPDPAGIPDGPVRSLVLRLLAEGSTRGTAFPSSHVAIATAISLAVLGWNRWFGAALLATTILLATGAVYGGFHYLVDVVAGFVLGAAAWGISTVVYKRLTLVKLKRDTTLR